MASKSWLPDYAARSITRRQFLAGAAAGAGAAALIACGGGSGGGTVSTLNPSEVRKPGALVFSKDQYLLADQTKEAVPGGTLTTSEADVTESLDVYISTTPQHDTLSDMSYEYLLKDKLGPGIVPGSPTGALAESWEVSNDAMTFTFKLRPNVKFHNLAPVNGRVMNIDDWRTSLKRFMEIGSNSPAWNDVVDKAEFPDSTHMVLKLKLPYGPLLARGWDQNFAPKIVPKELNDKPELSAEKMIGTNYRAFQKFEPSIAREFTAHKDYWDGKPFIDRWFQPIIPEYANGYAQFIAQNIYNFSPSAADALKLRKDAPQAIMVGSEITRVRAYRMLFGKREKDTSPWKDPRVRIAMHRAVDWGSIAKFNSNYDEFTRNGVDIELFLQTHVPDDNAYYLDPRKGELGKESENYIYDPAASKQLLTAAGYPTGFDIDMYFNAGGGTATPGQTTAANNQLYLDYYKKTEGMIRVKDIYLTRQEFFDRVVYAADIKGIQQSQPSSSNDVDYLLFRTYSSKYHLASYTDAEVDKAIDDQRKATDATSRAEVIKEFQRLMASRFYALPAQWNYNTFSFQWDWTRNLAYIGGNPASQSGGQKIWLAADMPHRNG